MKTSEFSRKMNCFAPASLLCIVLLMAGLGTRASASLLGYWQFDEGSGPTTADSSGNKLTGTLAGTPIPVWVTGKVGPGALDFTPTARVSLANDPLLQLTGPLTLTAWAWADVNGSGRIITKGGNNGFRGWSLGIESAGYYSFQIPSSASSLTSINTAAGTLALGVWTHVAAVYDPTALTMNLYTNGVLAPTTLNGTVPAVMYNPATISPSIGTRSDGTTRWDGKLDEIRIYNEALTIDQIRALPELASVIPEPSTLAICGAMAAMMGLRRFVRVRR